MREVNLDGIKEKYQQVKAFIETLGEINEEFNAEQGITEDYLGPFNKGYELKVLIAKIREDLISFVIDKLNSECCPNVTIEHAPIEKELTEKFGELEFNSNFIKHYILTNYVSHSETLSREEICDHARKLVPFAPWSAGARREVKFEDIQQGRKLRLRLYMDSYYSDTYHLLVYNRFGYPTKSLLNKVGRQTLYNLPIDPFYYCRIFDIMDKRTIPCRRGKILT